MVESTETVQSICSSIGFGQEPAENPVPGSVGGETAMPLSDCLPGAELRGKVRQAIPHRYR